MRKVLLTAVLLCLTGPAFGQDRDVTWTFDQLTAKVKEIDKRTEALERKMAVLETAKAPAAGPPAFDVDDPNLARQLTLGQTYTAVQKYNQTGVALTPAAAMPPSTVPVVTPGVVTQAPFVRSPAVTWVSTPPTIALPAAGNSTTWTASYQTGPTYTGAGGVGRVGPIRRLLGAGLFGGCGPGG